MRLTRPEVVLTWLPAYVDGESHGDHQAAAVIATEAFDSAGDPTAFPEQVSAPRDRLSISNYGEGLHCWQAKKLYFFSDTSHPEFLAHKGPGYLATEISRNKGVPFSELNKIAWGFYATQAEASEKALHLRIYKPDYLVLGKSLVTAPLEGDVFAGIDKQAIAHVPPSVLREAPMPPLSLRFGGPWAFYRDFYPVHGLDFLATLIKPQSGFVAGRPLWIPLLLCNHSHTQADLVLHGDLPDGWELIAKDISYRVEPIASILSRFSQGACDRDGQDTEDTALDAEGGRNSSGRSRTGSFSRRRWPASVLRGRLLTRVFEKHSAI